MPELDRILEANKAAQHAWQLIWDAIPYSWRVENFVYCTMRDAMGELREACMAVAPAEPENALADGDAEGC